MGPQACLKQMASGPSIMVTASFWGVVQAVALIRDYRAEANLDRCSVIDVEGDQVQRGSMALLQPLQGGRRLRLPRGCHHVAAGRKHLSRVKKHIHDDMPYGRSRQVMSGPCS